jgi:DNA repair protein RecN (Recombination protein N)
MLTHLEVKDFALIDDVCMDFSPHLNILTGETGAGKSIILGALKLLLGDRASTDSIRAGSETSLIQGVFELSHNSAGAEELENLGFMGEEIILTREINRQGKNLCRANGVVIPLILLKKIGQHLIDFHGQHEHQSLLDPGKHIKVLDLLCGAKVLGLKEELKAYYAAYRENENRFREYSFDEKQRAHRLDLYNYQLHEIETASLKETEEEEHLKKLHFLANAERISSCTQNAYNQLAVSGNRFSVSDSIQQVLAVIEEACRLESSLEKYREQVLTAAEILQDTARELRHYSDSITTDPMEMAEVEKRMAEIEKLKKKYGNTVKEILAYAVEIKKEKEKLETMEETLAQLTLEKEELLQKIAKLSDDLSRKRQLAAREIEEAMKRHLRDLALEGAIFNIKFFPKEISANGSDHVEFMFSANAGEPEKPLHRIVSGGELSRVMLALKNIMAEWQWVPTLIFDELDAGIGGRTVQSVGEKVLNLAVKHQVICITHWPQIAALSHKHFSIRKEMLEKRTVTRVREIQGDERTAEIARMLDGGEKGSLEHAKTILERANSKRISKK